MFRSSFVIAVVVAACAVACTSNPNNNDASVDAGLDVERRYVRPPVPDGALLAETPEFTIPGGSETLFCTFTSVTLAQAMDTREIHSYQLRGGHHAVLFFTMNTRAPDAPHECTEEDMNDVRFVGGGDEAQEQALRLPEGIGVRIPAGAQLVIQSHYLNLDSTARRVQDAMTVVPATPGAIQHIADAFAMNDGDFAVPPHAMYGRTMEYPITAEMNVVMMLGHMHDMGLRVRVELLPAAGGARDLYNEQNTGLRLRSNPPLQYYTPAAPLTFHPGDRVRLHCDWNNTSSGVLSYPEEMCSTLMYYWPAMGFLSGGRVIETRGGGGDGGVSTDGNAGCPTPPAPGEACVRPCNTGNELGVGKYCTPGGNECRGNRSAIICVADVDPMAPPYCTKPCSSDLGCGSGAVCEGDSRGMGCLPIECSDRQPDAGAAIDATVAD